MKFIKQNRLVKLGVVVVVCLTPVFASVWAAESDTSQEPESGNVTAPASIASDSSASDALAVEFGGGATQSLNCAPNPADSMTNTVSHLCGFPDTTNTGVPNDISLVPVNSSATDPNPATCGQAGMPSCDNTGWHWDSRGWVQVDTDGAIVDGISLSGGPGINIAANNVTVKNSQVIMEGDSWAIGLAATPTVGTTIEDCTFGSPASSGENRMAVAIKDVYGQAYNTKVLRNNIYHTSTGVQMSAGTIQDNYIHDMALKTGDHINGTTSNGNFDLDGVPQQLDIIHNTIFNKYGQTDAVSLFQDFGGQDNRSISDNLLAGGGYVIYAGGPGTGCTTPNGTDGCYSLSSNIKVMNNHYSTMFYPDGGSYGTVAYFNDSGVGNITCGNLWNDGSFAGSGADQSNWYPTSMQPVISCP